ncbi:MAG: hypothetical protein HGA45_06735 [Chloroflexales bacterium]|nr:hypothetical protein [Chloroflexales bacterium]
MAASTPEPNWQPISQLSTVAWAFNGMADEAVDMLGSLREAAPKPHVLDDATVNRVIKLYTEQQEDLWLYAEQLRRWQAGKLTASQHQEVAGLSLRLGRLRADIAAILELAAYLKPRTIDAVLARSDEELALDILTGVRPPAWSAPPSSAPAPEPAPDEADAEDEPDEADADDLLTGGEPLTPTMRALLQIAGCLEGHSPIPIALLIAPLPPHAASGGPVALASLLQQGCLTAPSLATVQLTPKGRVFLAAHPSEEPARRTVIQALCGLLGQLMRERDEATLRLVEPHLLTLADAWAAREDEHALMLCLGAGTYLTLFGDAQRARPYLDRAKELDAALGGSSPKLGRTRRGRR